MNEVVVGVLLGAGVGIVSSIIVAFVAERRARTEWRRQTRLDAARKIVRAFQTLNREITNLAISDVKEIDGTASQ
ncbi:hypothetical protein ACPW96_16765 [Micromonospora sp. DT81.3]|uniref:hypothetical protein n=1 Tax=Micromonospora sp. DT81.3 TaxID=3416523 RepID=UPI003CF85220